MRNRKAIGKTAKWIIIVAVIAGLAIGGDILFFGGSLFWNNMGAAGESTGGSSGGQGGGGSSIFMIAIFAIPILLIGWGLKSYITRPKPRRPTYVPPGVATGIVQPPKHSGKNLKPWKDQGYKTDIPKNLKWMPPATPEEIALEKKTPRYAPQNPIPSGQHIKIEGIEPWFLPIRNQGNCSSCVAFAVTSVYEFILNRLKGKPRREAKRSESFLWYNCRPDPGQNEGTYPVVAAEKSQNDGNCNIVFWLYDDNFGETHTKPPEKTYDKALIDAKQHCIEKVCSLSLDNPDEWIQALYDGNPVITSVRWPVKMFDHSDKTLFKEENLVYSSGQHQRHAIVTVGYDSHYPAENGKTVEAFRIRNSWGTGWCDEGYRWIERETLRKIAEAHGSLPMVITGRVKKGGSSQKDEKRISGEDLIGWKKKEKKREKEKAGQEKALPKKNEPPPKLSPPTGK